MNGLNNEQIARILHYLPYNDALQARRLSKRCDFIVHDYFLVKQKDLSIKYINMLSGSEPSYGEGKTYQGGLTLGCALKSNDTDAFTLTMSPTSVGHAVLHNSNAKPQHLIDAYYKPEEPDVSALLEYVISSSSSIKLLNVVGHFAALKGTNLWDDEMVDIFLNILEATKCKVESFKIASPCVAKMMRDFGFFERISINQEDLKVFMDSTYLYVFGDELVELASFSNLILEADSEKFFLKNIRHLIQLWFNRRLTASFVIECEVEHPDDSETDIFIGRDDERLRSIENVYDLPTTFSVLDEESGKKLMFTLGHRMDDDLKIHRTVLSFREE